MKLFMDMFFLIAIVYFSYKFVQVLIKMKQKVIFPITHEEIATVRKHPDKPLGLPIYSKQKVGITFYAVMLLYLIIMFFLGSFLQLFDWSLYFLLLLPLANAYDLFNQFAVLEDGLLSGSRFIAWKRVKSFRFVPIDMNHKYYGFSQEANKGYELKIKIKGIPISCVVTSTEMQEKLTSILREYVEVMEEESVLKESK